MSAPPARYMSLTNAWERKGLGCQSEEDIREWNRMARLRRYVELVEADAKASLSCSLSVAVRENSYGGTGRKGMGVDG